MFKRGGARSSAADRQLKRSLWGAWWRILRTTFTAHAGRSLAVFVSDLFATFFQLAAIGVVVALARVLSSDGVFDIGWFAHTFPLDRGTLISGVLITLSLLALAELVQFGTGVLVAKYRADMFGDYMRRALRAVREGALKGNLGSLDAPSASRMLRRDCRYMSRAVIDVMSLPRQLVSLAAIFGAGLYFEWGYTLLLTLGIALAAPLHMGVAQWAARSARDLLKTARDKSASDTSVVDLVLRHPFPDTVGDDVIEGHPDTEGVAGFLRVYGRRSRLGAVSQLVSGLSGALAIGILAVVVIEGFLSERLDVSSAVLVMLAFRMAASYMAGVAQTVAVVSGYQPFFVRLQDLLDGVGTEVQRPQLSAAPQSGIHVVVQPQPLDYAGARMLAAAFADANAAAKTHLVLSEYALHGTDRRASVGLPNDYESSRFKTDFPGATPERIAEIEAWLTDPGSSADAWSCTTPPVRTLLALRSAIVAGEGPVVAFGSPLNFITRPEQRVVFEKLGDRPLIIVYQSVPRRITAPPDADVYLLNQDQLEHLGRVDEFDDHRAHVDAEMLRERARLAADRLAISDDTDEAVEVV